MGKRDEGMRESGKEGRSEGESKGNKGKIDKLRRKDKRRNGAKKE